MKQINKNIKATIPVVTITLFLLVGVTAIMVIQNWFLGMQQDFQNKELQKSQEINKAVDIYGIKAEDNIHVLYLKGNVVGYKKIDKINLNKEKCTLLGTNGIFGNRITKIQLDCNIVTNINDLTIFTNQEIIEKTKN